MPSRRVQPQRSWQLQHAKNRFSELGAASEQEGPQIVTRRGVNVAVVLAFEDFSRLTEPKGSLIDFLKRSPLRRSKLEVPRDRGPGRKVDL